MKLLYASLAVLAVADSKAHGGFTVSLKASVKNGDNKAKKIVDGYPLHATAVVTNNSAVVNVDRHAEAESWKGVLCIVGGALAHLTLGTLYCWGNFLSYAPDYLRFFDGHTHPGVPPDALYVIPFTIVAQAIAMPFGPLLTKAVGASRALMIGCVIAAASVYTASFQKSLASFILFYSIFFGAGAGIAYTAPMAAGWKWMPNSKGLVSGGILAGFGSGGFIFSLIGSRYANPSEANLVNGRFPDAVYANFPGMLRRLSSIYLVVAIVGCLLVSEPPAAPVQAVLGTVSAVSSTGSVSNPSSLGGLTLSESLKTRYVPRSLPATIKSGCSSHTLHACSEQSVLVAVVHDHLLRHRGSQHGFGLQAVRRDLICPRRRSIPGSGRRHWRYRGCYRTTRWHCITSCSSIAYCPLLYLTALFNGCGRLFWGSVSDKIGFKNSFTILTLLQATSMFTYKYSVTSKVRAVMMIA